jgi:hypothetical protein
VVSSFGTDQCKNWVEGMKERDAYKLSLGPKTFVGIAEVKLQPNSSLYALYRHQKLISIRTSCSTTQTRTKKGDKTLTDSERQPSSSRGHTRSYSHEAGLSGFSFRRVGR